MKKSIIFIFFICSFLFAQNKTNSIKIFVQSNGDSVELKWLPKNYMSENSYKLYRSSGTKKRELISTVKSRPYEFLKNSGFSDDYIFMIYPFKDANTLKERIKVDQVNNKISVFRAIKIAEDTQFSRNIGQYYKDTNVEQNKIYNYELELILKNKKITSSKVSIKNKAYTKDNQVFWIQAKDSNLGVSLNWDISNKDGFYNIYRKLSAEQKFLKLTRKPSYINLKTAKKNKSLYFDETLSNGQDVEYYVTKVNMFSKESKASSIVKIKHQIKINPKKVTNIFVKNQENKIVLRWKELKNIDGYNIYRSSNSKGGFIKINNTLVKENVYFDRSFNIKQNYYYYITAVNKTIESSPSSKILAYVRDATPPVFPKLLKVNVSVGKIDLEWKKVKDKNLLGYKIYMSMNKEKKEWALITRKAISESFFVHNRAKELSGNFYYYKVTAIDKSFNESASSNIVKVKLPDVTPPSQPIFIRHNIYPSRIKFAWGKSLEKDLDYYNLYTQKGKKLIRINKKPIKKTFFEFNNPATVGFRKYIVTAVDKSGNESKKDEHILIKGIDITAPKIENVMYSLKGENIEINFSVKDNDYNGFEILRSSGKVKRYSNISGFKKGKVFIDKNIPKGKTYFYRLKVYDKSGNISLSNVKEIKID